MKHCLSSFAKDSVSAGPSGVPYMFLHFPEGDTLNRETLASSLEFAKREVGVSCASGCLANGHLSKVMGDNNAFWGTGGGISGPE